MGATNQTANINLPQFVDSDRPTWRGDINGAFVDIDNKFGTVDGAIALKTSLADALTAATTMTDDHIATQHASDDGEYLPISQKSVLSGVAALSATGALLSAVPSGSVGGGVDVLNGDTTGTCTAFGAHALAAQTSGISNNAFGDTALQYNTTGTCNCAFGTVALKAMVTGHDNCAFGNTALGASTGNNNSAFGSNALCGHTTGVDNTAVGSAALGNDAIVGATGFGNTAVGARAISNNTTGTNNVAVGLAAMFTNAVGLSNVAVGFNALFSSISNSNTAIGAQALLSQTDAMWNTSLGGNSGYTPNSVMANATVHGSGNTWLGYNTGAGSITDPSYCLAIGYKATCIGAGSVAIGTDHTGVGAASAVQDELVLGTTLHTTRIPGIPAFVAADHYLVVDSTGHIHKSALGPAS